MQFSRREFLKSACSAVSVVAYPQFLSSFTRILLEQCKALVESGLFPLGISSGDVTATRAIVWTRYLGLLPIRLAVWESGKSEKPAVVFAAVTPLDGGYVHVDVTNLKPQAVYQFVFIEHDMFGRPISRSKIGRFRTAPDSNSLQPVTVGAVSCTHNDYEPVVLEHAGARNDIDLFLLLGDTSYNDGCETHGEFRDRWGSSLSKKGYLDLRASTSVIATLDDHEISDNFDPEKVSYSVRNAAIKSFFENTPIRVNPNKWNRIWRSFRIGRTVEIFVLDCRLERRPSTRHSGKGIYISKEQMEWLKQSLEASDAVFKIIMNSVPIGTFPFFYENDRWEGYPEQRLEILSFIDDKEISGVLWLSGDFHFASVGRVSYEGPGSRQIEILAGPGAQTPNYLAAALNLSPQFDWSSVRNNYLTLTFDPKRFSLQLVYFGGLEDPTQTKISDVCEIYRQTINFEKECLIRCEGSPKQEMPAINSQCKC